MNSWICRSALYYLAGFTRLAHCLLLVALGAVTGIAAAQPNIDGAGNASYSIPIAVPPGIAGMAPNLSLLFSGTALNGPVGSGWTIQGISNITRCAGDRVIDGVVRSVDYTGNDKLCLDGQRLIVTDSAGNAIAQGNESLGGSGMVREYRTEKDIYARIRAYGAAGGNAANGPAYFRVWTKAGQIYEYGTASNATANAQITVLGRAVVSAWPVSRIGDTVGNYIDFQYEQRDVAFGTNVSGSGTPLGHEWNLLEIRYTGTPLQSPTNKVRFVYADRPDAAGAPQDRSEAYHIGAKNVSVRLLSNIQTYINWPAEQGAAPQAAVPAKNYALTYDHGPVTGRSRLRKVAECAGNGVAKCMPGTSFEYADGGGVTFTPNQAFRNSVLATTILQNQAGTLGVIRADFNGDGKLDLLRWSDTPNQNSLFLSSPIDGQYTQATNFNILDQNLFKSDGCFTALVTDMNGDGLPDLLRYSAPQTLGAVACSNFGPTYIYRNNGDGSFTRLAFNGPALERVVSKAIDNCLVPRNPLTKFCAEPGDHDGWTRGANFYLFDADGDGRIDVVTTLLPKYNINDAVSDPCLVVECTQVFHSNGDGTFTKISTNLAHVSIYLQPATNDGVGATRRFRDVNRDGVTDLVWLPTRYFNKNPFYISRGDGNFDGSTTPLSSSCDTLIDFNGDGLDDCLTPGTTAATNSLFTAQGNGIIGLVTNFNLTGAGQEMTGTSGIDLGDIDGDGREDILRWQDSPAGNAVYLSNGDGTFRTSAFNLTSASDQLQKSDGTASFMLGDFTGRGHNEILRTIAAPSAASDATRNQLYTQGAAGQADQLIAVTSPLGIRSTLTWVPLTNSATGAYGTRYAGDRGTANAAAYPVADVIWPNYVVATISTDSGTGDQEVSEYSYAGMKVANDGRGLLGFRQVRQQHKGANGDNLTVTTQYLQTGGFTGMAAVTDTRLGGLDAVNGAIISRTTHIYCDVAAPAGAAQAATMAAPCVSSAKVQRPYLYRSIEEGSDLNGVALPTVTTTNTFNGSGDPTLIDIATTGVAAGGLAQTFTRTTVNQYQPDATSGDAWLVGRLSQATVTNAVSNDLGRIATSAGFAPNASATEGTSAVLVLACTNGPPTTTPTAATATCSLNNTGILPAASITYSALPGITVSGPPGPCAAGASCGTVTLTSGTAPGTYGGTLTAMPNTGAAASAAVSLIVRTPAALALACYGGDPATAPASASLSCTVSNQGQTPIASIGYSAIAGTAVTGPTGACAAGATCGTVVVMTGGAAGTYTGVLTATPNAGAPASVNVSLTVRTPAALAFSCSGGAPSMQPTPATLSCALYNNGQVAVGSIAYSSIAGAIVDGPTWPCAGNSFCGTVTVTTSGEIGTYAGTLTVTPNTGSGVSVAVNLRVNSVPQLMLACAGGGNTITPTPATLSCTLTNIGQTAASTITYSTAPGTTVSGPATCGAGAACGTVTVVSDSAPGTYSGTLLATPNAGSAGATAFSLTVLANTTSVAPTPTSYSYGTIKAGALASHTFTIVNTGQVATDSLLVKIQSTSATGRYYLYDNTCPATLGAGASCTIRVEFETTCGARAGSSAAGTVIISGTNFNQVTISLTGVTAGGVCV